MLVYCVTSTTASELICLRTRWAAQQCMYQLAVREYSEKKKINAPGSGVKIVWKTSIWYFKIFTINKENLSLWSATAMSKSRLPLGLTVALCRCCLCFSCQTSSHCPWSCIVRSQGLNKQKMERYPANWLNRRAVTSVVTLIQPRSWDNGCFVVKERQKKRCVLSASLLEVIKVFLKYSNRKCFDA